MKGHMLRRIIYLLSDMISCLIYLIISGILSLVILYANYHNRRQKEPPPGSSRQAPQENAEDAQEKAE